MKKFRADIFWRFLKMIFENKQIVIIGERDDNVSFDYDCRSVEDAEKLCEMTAFAFKKRIEMRDESIKRMSKGMDEQ